jgi:hypothetical protein
MTIPGDGDENGPTIQAANGHGDGPHGGDDPAYIVFGYGSLIFRVRFLRYRHCRQGG